MRFLQLGIFLLEFGFECSDVALEAGNCGAVVTLGLV